ncbi:uncharacterized protein LOC132140335 [Carassius carassius]|uniref:uncharacterized protein LOC132140335 n=1 Tax=Carassius carassius TaxID=217509 RepID=UPI0028697F22|nr:uncharacterized protein LOC132140335 [Carassius carassius]
MVYLGQGLPGSSQDEMKVLQQICGGENICVFKGFVQPGEQFQFTSQRHLGFPFSATVFVNGIIAARISSCCEYRYAPGFQQGRRSCFRLTRLNGGKPCYKCVNSRHGIGTPAIDSPAPVLQKAINSNEGVMESCPSSPLFVPLGMERSLQKTRKLSKDGGALSTDSEDVNGSAKEKKRHKRHQGQRSLRVEGKSLEESQAHKKENKPPSNTKEQLQTSAKEHVPDKENSVTENKTKVPGEWKSFPAMWFPTLKAVGWSRLPAQCKTLKPCCKSLGCILFYRQHYQRQLHFSRFIAGRKNLD